MDIVVSTASEDFARAFGDALKSFLDDNGITYSSAARKLGVTKQTLSTYWSNDFSGRRRKPRAELLFRACAAFRFAFEYKGYRVTANSLVQPKMTTRVAEQLRLEFSRQFKLTEDGGEVSVRLRRQPNRVELAILLKASS